MLKDISEMRIGDIHAFHAIFLKIRDCSQYSLIQSMIVYSPGLDNLILFPIRV